MSNCIISTAWKNKDGYAIKRLGTKVIGHHRIVYCEFHRLPLSSIKGLCVCHKCDNPPCINPLHLFLGTKKDNSQDMVNKGRQSREIVTPKLTEADVLAIRGSSLNGKQLARKYNVNRSTIYSILKRRGWKHI